MKRLIMALAIAGLGLTLSGTAGAFTQTATGTINVDATVVAACTVATTPLSFGNYTPGVALPGTATITVNCVSGVPYRIDIDGGLNNTGTADRDMMDVTTHTSNLLYNLYKDAAHTNVWGDNGATLCTTYCGTPPTGKTGTGTGVDAVHTVYGYINATTGILQDTHTDTLTVTVNY